MMARSAGVLLHITSLPSPFGIGDLGPAAYRFADLLARADATWWQILPLTPPSTAESPYCSTSTFAGNPLLISPELLQRDGLLAAEEIAAVRFPAGRVDYPAVRAFKARLLEQAFARMQTRRAKHLGDALAEFCRQEAWWLDDFALYAALRETHGLTPWPRWGRALARRQPHAIKDARGTLAPILSRIRFEQFLFARQFSALRDYAHSKGIRLMGDVPIYVDLDSADVWSHPKQFKLRADGWPKVVAGVPPDYFSKDGQLWGNPLYNWDAMRNDHFEWWIRRVKHLTRYVDVVRIDHFRGLQACWEVPAGAKTAKRGHYSLSPGAEILTHLREELGGQLPLVAEDLGTITPEMEKLRDDFGLPGMRVLQFAFDSGPANTMLPHHYSPNLIAYTGTHDNDTTLSWSRRLPVRTRGYLQRYAPDAADDAVRALMRMAMASAARLAIIPLQDILRIGREGRMNTPGTAAGNWRWRVCPEQICPSAFAEFRDLVRTYGRARAT